MSAPEERTCPRCGAYAARDQVYGDRAWYECGSGHRFGRASGARQQRTALQQLVRWRDRRWTKPRTRLGRPLQLTPELRAAWADVRRARRLDSFERRAQAFIGVLLGHTRDDLDVSDDADVWCERATVRDGRFEISRSRGGAGSQPTIVLRADSYGLLGEYVRNVLKGKHEIRIFVGANRSRFERGKATSVLAAIRETLVHECLHLIDGEAGIEDGGHDGRWRQRLARMEVLFPPTSWGKR